MAANLGWYKRAVNLFQEVQKQFIDASSMAQIIGNLRQEAQRQEELKQAQKAKETTEA